MDHTKIYTAYLDFPRQELSNGGQRFVVALTFFRELFFCVRALGVQSSCRRLHTYVHSLSDYSHFG